MNQQVLIQILIFWLWKLWPECDLRNHCCYWGSWTDLRSTGSKRFFICMLRLHAAVLFAKHSRNYILILNFFSSVTIFSEMVLLCHSSFPFVNLWDLWCKQSNFLSCCCCFFLTGRGVWCFGYWDLRTHEDSRFVPFSWKNFFCAVFLSWIFEALCSIWLLSIKCLSVDRIQILNISNLNIHWSCHRKGKTFTILYSALGTVGEFA